MPVTVSISIPVVSWVFFIRSTRAAVKPGTNRAKQQAAIAVLPIVRVKGIERINERAKPTAVTMYWADMADERRFVGEDSPIIIIITSFVE